MPAKAPFLETKSARERTGQLERQSEGYAVSTITLVVEISAAPTLTVKTPASELTLILEYPAEGGAVESAWVGVGIGVAVLMGVGVFVGDGVAVGVGVSVGVGLGVIWAISPVWNNLSSSPLQVGFPKTATDAKSPNIIKGRKRGIIPF